MKRAELPAHFTRTRSGAPILIVDERSPAYVQARLGHKNVTLTVDTYGKSLPKGDKAAIDSLDDRNASVDANSRAVCAGGTAA